MKYATLEYRNVENKLASDLGPELQFPQSSLMPVKNSDRSVKLNRSTNWTSLQGNYSQEIYQEKKKTDENIF